MNQKGLKASKKIEATMMTFLFQIEKLNDIDHRSLALAKTNIQQGFMWLNRSLEKVER